MSQLFISGGQSIGVSASASVLPMNRMDLFYLPAIQGTLKSLLQHHSSKASILWRSACFMVQLSHPYMKVKVELLSRVQLLATPWSVARQAPLSMGSSGQECWSGLHCLLRGIFQTQESNPSLLHWRRILFHLSRRGSPEGQF